MVLKLLNHVLIFLNSFDRHKQKEKSSLRVPLVRNEWVFYTQSKSYFLTSKYIISQLDAYRLSRPQPQLAPLRFWFLIVYCTQMVLIVDNIALL